MSNFSIKNSLAKAGAPLKRKLVDKVVQIEGIPVNVLKATSTSVGMSGDTTQTFEYSILSDVIMRFPTNEVEMIESLNDDSNVSVDALDLWDFLPVRLIAYFNGEYETEASKIKVGDIIVHVFYDENNNKIPMIFNVARPMGRFISSKYLVKREWDLSKYRGQPEPDLQYAIEEFLENLDEFN